MKRTYLTLIAFIGLAIGLGLAGPASASSQDPMQTRIDQVLADYPGGVQSDWNEVSWADGDVILTLAVDGYQARAAVGTCASGKYCAYSGPSQGGNKMTFTTCGNQSVSALGAPVKSLANARTAGSVVAKNGSTVVLSVATGAIKNTSATVTQVSCA